MEWLKLLIDQVFFEFFVYWIYGKMTKLNPRLL